MHDINSKRSSNTCQMARFFLFLLGTSSLATLLILYLGHNEAAQTLSPQGCRMSRMSPSYIQQARFDAHWTQLGNRYSLWLYREVGWEPNEVRAYSHRIVCHHFYTTRSEEAHQSYSFRGMQVHPAKYVPLLPPQRGNTIPARTTRIRN